MNYDTTYTVASLIVSLGPAMIVLLMGATIEYALITSIFVMVASDFVRPDNRSE